MVVFDSQGVSGVACAFLGEVLLKFIVDFKLPDKSEFSNEIASASERNSEPRKGRHPLGRGGAATCHGVASER